jgi:hypothetical protein
VRRLPPNSSTTPKNAANLSLLSNSSKLIFGKRCRD